MWWNLRTNSQGLGDQTVPDDSGVQEVPVKHDFNEKFEMEKCDGEFVGKGELYYIY